MSWRVRIDYGADHSILIRPIFAWYDLWVGAYWKQEARRLYVLPLPTLGFVVDFGRRLPQSVACGCEQCMADHTEGET